MLRRRWTHIEWIAQLEHTSQVFKVPHNHCRRLFTSNFSNVRRTLYAWIIARLKIDRLPKIIIFSFKMTKQNENVILICAIKWMAKYGLYTYLHKQRSSSWNNRRLAPKTKNKTKHAKKSTCLLHVDKSTSTQVSRSPLIFASNLMLFSPMPTLNVTRADKRHAQCWNPL